MVWKLITNINEWQFDSESNNGINTQFICDWIYNIYISKSEKRTKGREKEREKEGIIEEKKRLRKNDREWTAENRLGQH